MTGNIPESFRNHIRIAMKRAAFNEIPTDEVLVRLAQYVVLTNILDHGAELKRALCASKMMNYMLVAKAQKRPIPNKRYILDAYGYHLSKYVEQVDLLTENVQSDLRSRVPRTGIPLQMTEEEENDFCLALKEASLYRIEHLLTSDLIQNIDNPFLRIYVGLCKMFECLPYYLYNLDVKRIVSLLGKNEKKRKKLMYIINDIQTSDCMFNQDCGKTSVILSMIMGEKHKGVGDLMLSQKEFAVYLYYELLTEKIIEYQNLLS